MLFLIVYGFFTSDFIYILLCVFSFILAAFVIKIMIHVVPLELIKKDALHNHPKLLLAKHTLSIDNEYDEYLSNDYYKF